MGQFFSFFFLCMNRIVSIDVTRDISYCLLDIYLYINEEIKLQTAYCLLIKSRTPFIL